VIGSTVLILLKILLQQSHRAMVEIWAIVLGLILLVVVLFAPGGLVGLYQQIFKKAESAD